MNNWKQFNEQFPNSKYRLVHPYVEITDDPATVEQYQAAKAPVSNKVYTYDELTTPEMLKTITENKYRVGWIVSDGFIVVDIDNRTESRIVFDILQTKKVKFSFMVSKHGGHFIFKTDDKVGQCVGQKTNIGITVDTRVPQKGYIVLPINDPDRSWGSITNDVDLIPHYLKPLKGFKCDTDFISIGAGDGRNDALFRHIKALQDYDKVSSNEEKVEAVYIINQYLFKEPLSADEMEKTVLRPEIVSKIEEPKDDVSGCMEEKIASRVLGKYNLLYTTGDRFYLYNGKYYRQITDPMELERLLHFEYGKNLKTRQRKEIIDFIRLKAYMPSEKINSCWTEVVLRNGVFNLATKQLVPHSPTQYNTCYIDTNYVENAPFSKTIDDFFNKLAGADISKKTLLYEIVGYCLLRRNIFAKFFICLGEGQTGKSTFLNLITKLVGAENTSYISLSDLETQFMPAELFGKLVNIGDDIEYRPLKETAVLKKVVTGQMFEADVKHSAPLKFSNFATLIFTANQMPSIDDKTSGLYRRLTIIELNNKITNPDPLFLDRLTDGDMEYLLWKAIDAVYAAIQRQELTVCHASEDLLKDYIRDQSSILSFIDDKEITRELLYKKSCAEVYTMYVDYCKYARFMPYKKTKFDNEMCKVMKMYKRNTTSDGANQCWRYVSDDLSSI